VSYSAEVKSDRSDTIPGIILQKSNHARRAEQHKQCTLSYQSKQGLKISGEIKKKKKVITAKLVLYAYVYVILLLPSSYLHNIYLFMCLLGMYSYPWIVSSNRKFVTNK
jgi:hypothetical protein